MEHRITQEILVSGSPEAVYATLTDADKFRALCGGAPAQIDARAGGAFSCFGGMIHGINLECVPGERLVQAWRAKTWEEGVYSSVRFQLRGEKGGTRVILDHVGFPDGQAEHLAGGWEANYWAPLRKMF